MLSDSACRVGCTAGGLVMGRENPNGYVAKVHLIRPQNKRRDSDTEQYVDFPTSPDKARVMFCL